MPQTSQNVGRTCPMENTTTWQHLPGLASPCMNHDSSWIHQQLDTFLPAELFMICGPRCWWLKITIFICCSWICSLGRSHRKAHLCSCGTGCGSSAGCYRSPFHDGTLNWQVGVGYWALAGAGAMGWGAASLHVGLSMPVWWLGPKGQCPKRIWDSAIPDVTVCHFLIVHGLRQLHRSGSGRGLIDSTFWQIGGEFIKKQMGQSCGHCYKI